MERAGDEARYAAEVVGWGGGKGGGVYGEVKKKGEGSSRICCDFRVGGRGMGVVCAEFWAGLWGWKKRDVSVYEMGG